MYLLLFLFWILLNGRITMEIVIIGLLITSAVAFFANKAIGYHMKNDIRLAKNVPLMLLYVLNLIWEIIKAAFAVIKNALAPGFKPDPVIIEFHSGLKTQFENVLLANSITLTPGTYTLHQQDDFFVVHCLIPEYADGISESSFVRLLRKMK